MKLLSGFDEISNVKEDQIPPLCSKRKKDIIAISHSRIVGVRILLFYDKINITSNKERIILKTFIILLSHFSLGTLVKFSIEAIFILRKTGGEKYSSCIITNISVK